MDSFDELGHNGLAAGGQVRLDAAARGTCIFQIDAQGVYRVAAFERMDWLEHGFGTRVSTDWPDTSRLATLKQIHSARVLTAKDAGLTGEGDALITDVPGLLVGVRTADCVPILLVDCRKRTVAAVHAGWRGTAAQIAVCTILELASRFGTVAADLDAAIGPAIGPCCYVVGPEVAGEFARWWPELSRAEGPVKLDLVETNRRQLMEAGVAPGRIFTGAPCTACAADVLHSYRRERESAGRMMAAIGIR